MYDLIEALTTYKASSKEQAKDYANRLNSFRFDSNNMLDAISYLMSCAADGGDFKPTEETFREIGCLLAMLSELNSLCEDQESTHRRALDIKSDKMEVVS